ncbi:MAG: FMN-binding protein [Acidobacteria bacterium]|nr:FMN-binding protein [Acidobacteriota bacterium]
MQGALTRGLLTLGVGLAASGLWPWPVAAQALSREEALAAVYGDAEVRAERVFLTPDQMQRVESRAGADPPSPLVARYVATENGQAVGRAYVDTHTVRTKRESLLISLDAQGRVLRIDVTAFLEPPEYLAPEAWLDQYRGHGLGDDLAVDRAIRPIAGATLTARAANSAVRRTLAIDEVLRGVGDGQ